VGGDDIHTEHVGGPRTYLFRIITAGNCTINAFQRLLRVRHGLNSTQFASCENYNFISDNILKYGKVRFNSGRQTINYGTGSLCNDVESL